MALTQVQRKKERMEAGRKTAMNTGKFCSVSGNQPDNPFNLTLYLLWQNKQCICLEPYNFQSMQLTFDRHHHPNPVRGETETYVRLWSTFYQEIISKVKISI